MPQFCVGLAGTSIGDFGCTPGPIDVPRDIAEGLAQEALDGGVDLAVSLRMEVDHGMVQPLEILFGGLDTVPTVPFFINSVAPPFTPVHRVRVLGEAVGRYLSGLDKRVLLLGSGWPRTTWTRSTRTRTTRSRSSGASPGRRSGTGSLPTPRSPPQARTTSPTATTGPSPSSSPASVSRPHCHAATPDRRERPRGRRDGERRLEPTHNRPCLDPRWQVAHSPVNPMGGNASDGNQQPGVIDPRPQPAHRDEIAKMVDQAIVSALANPGSRGRLVRGASTPR